MKVLGIIGQTLHAVAQLSCTCITAFLPGEINYGNMGECEKDSLVTMLRKYDRSGMRERESAHVLKYSCLSSLKMSGKLCIKGTMGKWSMFLKLVDIYIIQPSTLPVLF